MAKVKTKEAAPTEKPAKLTVKQIRFCQEYMKDFNATRACIAAGYSKHTSFSIGSENLRKPLIKSYIEEKLAEITLSAEEATKLNSDIAKGSLNNYFTTKKVERIPRIQISLKEYISQKKSQLAFEEEFSSVAGFNEDEKKIHEDDCARRRRDIIRLELELKKNPRAYRIVDGQAELVDSVELDMAKLVADKERGRIKSVNPTAHGVKVELFSAEAAIANALKIHGKFAKDNEQLRPEISQPFSDSQVDKIVSSLRKPTQQKKNGK